MARMTEEEAFALDEKWTKTLQKSVPTVQVFSLNEKTPLI